MNERQRQIQELRDRMNSRDGNLDPFGDDFDKRFDKHFDRILNTQEKVLDHPVRTMILAGLVWLVGFAIVCGIIAFFVWLLFL